MVSLSHSRRIFTRLRPSFSLRIIIFSLHSALKISAFNTISASDLENKRVEKHRSSYVTPWSRAVFEKLIVCRLFEKTSLPYKQECSSPCSQKYAPGPYSKPHESSPNPQSAKERGRKNSRRLGESEKSWEK